MHEEPVQSRAELLRQKEKELAERDAAGPGGQPNLAMAVGDGGPYRIALTRMGKDDLGWLGWEGGGVTRCYAKRVTDFSQALMVRRSIWNNQTYYYVGNNFSDRDAWFLSVDINGQVAF